MTLTLDQLKKRARQARGGPPSAELTDEEVVNDAGNHLYTMHRWKFADRAPVDLNLVANQEWIDLPDDFGQIIRLARGTDSIVLTTPFEMNQRRALGVTTTDSTGNTFHGTIGLRPDKTVSGRPLAPRTTVLLLQPTPVADGTAAVVMDYRAGWTTLVAPSDPAVVPVYTENLLKALVRAFALGVEEDSLEERLERVQASRIFRTCAAHDGTVQQSWGHISGSAVDMYSTRHRINPLATETAAAPS